MLAAVSHLKTPPEILIVDAFVALGAERRPGLGWRLWEALGGRAAVIGAAKNPYQGGPRSAEVLRGDSARPLYVTAVGMTEAEARASIQAMHGPHRIPTLIKLADRLSRGC